MKVLTISFLYSDIQIPMHTSCNMGLLKQTWRLESFLHAQGFGLCLSSKIYVCTHTFLLEDKQCLTFFAPISTVDDGKPHFLILSLK